MSSTAAVATALLSRSSIGERALKFSAVAWWAVTFIGQWMFLYYVVGFYGRAIITGHIENWNRNREIFKGYVPGDMAWNAYFGAHVLLASVIAFGGVLQLVPQIRRHAVAFHRWNGRAFMLTALGGGITGLWMVLVRGVSVSGNGQLGVVALTLDAALILAFAAIAWRRSYVGDVRSHRRWALRLFMVANGVWFLRLGLFGWYALTGGAGLTDQLDGPVNFILDFASYLLPLACLEFYLRAKDGESHGGKLTAAIVLLTCTAYMCVGIFVLTMDEWPLMPRL